MRINLIKIYKTDCTDLSRVVIEKYFDKNDSPFYYNPNASKVSISIAKNDIKLFRLNLVLDKTEMEGEKTLHIRQYR